MANLVDSQAAFDHHLAELGFKADQKDGCAEETGSDQFCKVGICCLAPTRANPRDQIPSIVESVLWQLDVSLHLESQLRRLIFEAITFTVQRISHRASGLDSGQDVSKMRPQERDRRLA